MELIGRDPTCSRLADAIAAAGGGASAALVVSGPIGSGRTAVLTWLADHASGAATVVGPLAPDAATGPGALARHLARAIGAPGSAARTDDRYGLGAGLLAAMARASRDRPLVVLVDDVEGHDERSVDALGFAAHRLGTEGVVLVLACGPTPPAGIADLDRIVLDPLDPDAAAAVLDAHVGVPLPPERRAAAVAMAAGSPLVLVAVAAHWSGTGPTGTVPPHDPREAIDEAVAAGRYRDALDLADATLPDTVGADRVRVLRARVRARRALGLAPSGAAELVADAHALGASDDGLAGAVLTEAAITDTAALRSGRALVTARVAVERAGPTSAEADLAHIALGAALVLEGDVDAARPHLDRWPDLLARADVETAQLHLLPPVAMALIWAEDRDAARSLVDGLVATARRRPAPSVLPPALLVAALLDYGVGDWDASEAAALEAADLAEGMGDRPSRIGAAAQMALLAGLRGRTDDCARWAALVLDEPEARVGRLAEESARSGLAAAALGAGRPEEVVAALAPLAVSTDPRNPAPALWQADLVEAHLQLGHEDEARALVETLDQLTARSGHRRGQGIVARLRSLLSATDTDDDADVEAALARGFDLLDDPPVPFARARLELTWGERLAGEGRHDEARHRLAAARRAFERLDAQPWARRAAEGLARLGDPVSVPPAAVDLTPHERLVARALARGATIEEAAAELFLSPQTVARDAAAVLARLHVDAVADLPASLTGAADRPRIEVRVLGPLSVRRGDEDVTPAPGQPATVVRYLAVRGGRAHVEELVDALWPTVDIDRGRIRLRNVLARLRRTSPGVVEREGVDVVCWGEDVIVDLAAFEDEGGRALALARTDPEQAAALARRALDRLPAQPLLDAAYEPWAAGPRTRIETRATALADLL